MITVILSIFLTIFAHHSFAAVYSVMATCLTVLTGFTFTAYFSNASLAGADLPKPASEDDRVRLGRLSQLAVNFEARSKYFIPLSVISIALLGLGVIELKTPELIYKSDTFVAVKMSIPESIRMVSDAALLIASKVMPTLIVFLFLESLYTFYRMAETIISIVERRREYLHDRS